MDRTYASDGAGSTRCVERILEFRGRLILTVGGFRRVRCVLGRRVGFSVEGGASYAAGESASANAI